MSEEELIQLIASNAKAIEALSTAVVADKEQREKEKSLLDNI